MDQTTLDLNRLCARAEALQSKLARRRVRVNKENDLRRLREAVAEAKNRLMDALRIAEGMQ